jgi:hypothetical protein
MNFIGYPSELLKQRHLKMYYKLDENKNVTKSSLEEWSKFRKETFPINFLHIGDDKVNGKIISAVFVGINFNPYIDIPIVFETMVFYKGIDIYQERYSTYKEAEKGHQRIIQWVKNGCKEDE